MENTEPGVLVPTPRVPSDAVCAKRLVERAVVEKKLVEVALVSVVLFKTVEPEPVIVSALVWIPLANVEVPLALREMEVVPMCSPPFISTLPVKVDEAMP